MKALQFNTETREIVLSNGKTQTTPNPSIQNGIIIRDARCVNVYSPILGVGFNPINSQENSIVYQLNKWKKQCLQDGATTAEFDLANNGISNVTTDIDYIISYL